VGKIVMELFHEKVPDSFFRNPLTTLAQNG